MRVRDCSRRCEASRCLCPHNNLLTCLLVETRILLDSIVLAIHKTVLMESLLPSEIARLVLGYLEEQKCDDAAKSFLETCPHLQEIRTVISSGGTFTTRVNGLTLSDVLNIFCSINVIIQDRLSKISDCEQLKHCSDLPEHLRFLVDGSRGQRFKVTINVPQTSQTSGGSPIISSSMRKRHHSGSDRDRSKRANKTHSNSFGKSSEPVSSQLSCNVVETTPLEHLPGNSGSENAEAVGEKTSVKFEEHRPAHCSSTVTEAIGSQSLPYDRRRPRVGGFQATSLPDFQELRNLDANTANLGRSVAAQATHEKCTAATDTEELMRFTNTEVSETELTDEPVENLSLLTKELLNRTELQERIAENINKAILPADVSLKDVSVSESTGGEINISAMTELNNLIKSVVIATEKDPDFTQMLVDMLGPRSENDTSPDEDADQPFCTDGSPDNHADLVTKEPAIEASTPYVKKPTPEVETTEVPLKNRLRSSSSQQIVRSEEDRLSSQKSHKKEDIALEDLNAAAILSIINFNNKSDETPPSLDLSGGLLDLNVEADANTAISNQEESVGGISALKTDIPDSITKDTTENVPPEVSCDTLDGKSSRKLNARKARVPKQKAKVAPDFASESLIPDADMIVTTVPTLIFCPNEEVSNVTPAPSTAPTKPLIGGYCYSQFRHIAPKTDDVNLMPPKPEPIRLEVKTVPVDISKPLIAPKPGPAPEPQPVPLPKPRQPRRNTARITERKSRIAKQAESVAHPGNTLNPEPMFPTSELPAVEKVTLYGENSADAVLDETEIPAVQVEEPVISVSGTGLSPFLKFNSVQEQPQPKDAEVSEKVTNSEEAPAPEINTEPIVTVRQEASTSKENSYDVLMARTPRTLLKSRPKNHRLSKSTPRRRSHIRALNFNTPPKVINEHGRRKSTSETLQFSPKTSSFAKSVCRTSLFKSPPFVGASTQSKKIKSPAKDCRPCNIPIATRSPAPKLMGGWDKLTGVGMILVSESSSTSCSPLKPSAPSEIKSWDADLRSSLQLAEETQPKVTKKPAARKPQRRRQTRKKTIVRKSTSRIEECSSDRESPPPVKKSDGPLDVSVAPQNAPAKESRTIDITEKPNDTPGKIQVATTCESAPNETKEEVGTSNKTGAARKASDDVRTACKISEVTTTSTTKTVETVTSTTNLTAKQTDKTVKRKYAQLKTITTSVTKIERGERGIELVGAAIETVQRSSDFSRTHPSEVSRQISHMPDMLDLETPRKLENAFGIPPTPRLLSPSSSMTTPFGLQVGEDSGKMQSFITTPEFPPTPSIAVTPKQSSENTGDALKTQEPFTSAYYQPSSELKDPRLPRNDHSRHEMSLPLLGMMTKTTDGCVTDISVQVAQGFQACTTSSNLEITQFEVIKENLSREETFKELKISTSTREPAEKVDEANEISALPSITELDKPHETNDANKSGSTVGQDSDSDSSASSSGSSSSSSSSSSSDSSATNISAMMPVTKRYTEVTRSKIYTDTSNESAKKEAENLPSAAAAASDTDSKNLHIADHSRMTANLDATPLDLPSRCENEASPRKVFALAKTEEELKESIKETPAKDDSLLSEAVISETPSSSKAGIETLTNLNTKISALITSEDREFSKSNATSADHGKTEISPRKSLPKIVSVQRILPDISMALKPSPVVETLYSAMQSRNYRVLQPSAMSDAKLSRQLEEKRLRLVAKVKENEDPPAYRPRIKRAVALPKGRKSMNEREKSLAIEDKDDRASPKELWKRKSSRIREIVESLESAKKDVVERGQEKIVQLATKAETKKKSQMLKELFDESLTDEPETSKAASREVTEVSSKTTEETGKVTADAHVDNDVQKYHLPERPRERGEQETKSRKETAGQVANNSEGSPETIDNDIRSSGATEQAQISVNTKKEECAAMRTATSPIESKTATKSKVDLVKRDLFSDEESSDQRTTRSRTRQTSDTHKSESAESHIEVVSDPRNNRSATPNEDMPGVLKCLELVPTMKNDTADEEVNVMETSQIHIQFFYVYDDTVPTKRRKRKFSSSELEFVVQVGLSDDNYKGCSKLMTATPYEETFNLSPPRKRRGPSKDTALKATKCKRKDANTPKNAESVFKAIHDKPLATSSPVVKPVVPKVTSKSAKSPAKKSEPHQTDGKKKTAIKTEKTQSEHEKPNPKSRKRKASVSKDSEQVDKKSRTTDPQLLSKLNDVDLDEFLTTLHGPA